MGARLKHIPSLKYKGLLLLAAAIWGLGTVLIKGLVETIPPFLLVGIRFFTAGVVFAIIFAPQIIRLVRERRFADHVLASSLLGAAMIAGYMANSLGLTDTTAAKSSFLTGLYCVIVPFISWMVMHRRPTVFNIVAAILCVIGIGFVSLDGSADFSIGWGDAVTLLSALFLAIQLALTSKFAPGRDMMAITALQFLIGGAIALCVASFTEPLPDFTLAATPASIVSIVYMILFATCAALLLQNIGLAKVQPAQGSLILSFESVFGVLFSIFLLNESLTASVVVGFALIFAAVLISEWLPTSRIAVAAKRLRGRRASTPPTALPAHPDPAPLYSLRDHMPAPPYIPTARETSDT